MLPTKANMAHRLGGLDVSCPLCNEDEELFLHLFCKCPIARTVWFGVGLHSDALLVSNHEDLAQVVINPPITMSASCDEKAFKEQVSVKVALTLDSIWQMRNQAVHSDNKLNIQASIKVLELSIMEQILAIQSESTVIIQKERIWCSLDVGIVKLNIDAALLHHSATLAVVARNHNGELLKAWKKSIRTEDPLIAEASRIL